jgi:predicted acylesterase/phospholipase RssA
MKEILTDEKKQQIDDEFMAELKQQIADLKSADRYADARKVLTLALKEFRDDLWVNTQLALCYYLDDSLPMEERVSSALERLVAVDMAEPGEADGEDRMLRGFAAAFFTLGEYEQAGQLIAMLPERMAPESMAAFMDHLIRIGHSQGIRLSQTGGGIDASPAWQTLKPFLGEDPEARFETHPGKVGLALSGGGFRASLYHLGVLARLAEMDVLRQVEVISTVSGGSIVGALYYLKVKQLLETKGDADIHRSDYIDLVREIQAAFLTGIQQNIRVLAFSKLWPNLKMIFSGCYSRSHRMGELYEALLYREVLPGFRDGRPIHMDDLYIRPPGEPEFSPRTGNWRRRAKVPVLLINAANLNSGHGWHFTASFMGEPPSLLFSRAGADRGVAVDKNARYRRIRYREAPAPHNRYRLGYAVAASAGVPGLFPALPIQGLYPGKTVRLVDGGVHDNQGVAGLLDEGCTSLFVSDASGQMPDEDRPSDHIITVLTRASAITMGRVREEQYQELWARLTGGKLRGLFFIHLKKDFPSTEENWVGCKDPAGQVDDAGQLPYGITLALQNRMARIRTDLDTFTDVEAYSLMSSGYLMARQEGEAILDRCRRYGQTGKWDRFGMDAPGDEAGWAFLSLKPYLDSGTDAPKIRKDLRKQLSVARSRLFKAWRLDNLLKAVGGLMLLLILALLGLIAHANWGVIFKFSVGGTIIALAVFVLLPLAVRTLLARIRARWERAEAGPVPGAETATGLLLRIARSLSPEKALRSIAWDGLVALAGSLLGRFHLDIVDPAFRERGSLQRLLNLGRREKGTALVPTNPNQGEK